MHSTQRTLIELTKTPTIQQRIDRLMRETIGIVEKVALLMSMRTWFDSQYFPWIEDMSIEELEREIAELSASITIATVRVMNTPIISSSDPLEIEIQRREIQLDALDILSWASVSIGLKHYMKQVLARKIEERKIWNTNS